MLQLRRTRQLSKQEKMGSELNQPLVSMLIPSFNHGVYVLACIESIIAQDYGNIELIIIDDGSTDDSVHKIESMVPACMARFARFEFRSRPNKGLAATINEALEWSRGKYFAAIASDDLLLPKKTSTLLGYMEEDNDLAGVFCGCYILDSNGKKIACLRPQERFYSFEDIIIQHSNIIAPTQLLRLDCLKYVGGYPENLYIEDWYMWLALSEKGYRLRVVDALLVGYRQHEKNSSKNALKMYEARVRIMNVFSKKPQYKKSMAIICLTSTIDFTSISKIKATKFLFEGVGYSKKIIFSPLFVNCCLRLIIPRFLIVQAKEWKRVFAANSKDIVT